MGIRDVKQKKTKKQQNRPVLFLAGGIAALFVLILLIVLIVKGCRGDASGASGNRPGAGNTEEEISDNSITIVGVGDNLIHEALYLQCAKDDGSYDFSPFYRDVKGLINDADLAVVNQEGPLATDIAPPKGYPFFNTPADVLDALKDTGFDVINLANNHMTDMAEAGLQATIDSVRNRDLAFDGVYEGPKDASQFPVLEKNGIKVAFLGYTELVSVAQPSTNSCNIFMFDDLDLIRGQIALAKEHADIVVVCAHWGYDGMAPLSETEQYLAQVLVNAGADIIFGSHPHVLQELTVITRESDGAKCPVIYSLGNFLSGQLYAEGLISGTLSIRVERNDEDGTVRPVSMKFSPIVTYYEGDRDNLRLVPLSSFTETMSQNHGVTMFSAQPLTREFIDETLQGVIPAQYLDKEGAIQ